MLITLCIFSGSLSINGEQDNFHKISLNAVIAFTRLDVSGLLKHTDTSSSKRPTK